jgi:meso-butanediol dehydrogenase/(S,S)-butanediol dehydrogenase/diacetyl reductase
MSIVVQGPVSVLGEQKSSVTSPVEARWTPQRDGVDGSAPSDDVEDQMVVTGDYKLQGRTVVVTGAGSGIGRAIARAFIDQGCNVVLAGRREDALAETAEGAPPERVIAVPSDVTDRESVADLVAVAADRFGRIDVVVSNAAAYASGGIDALDEADHHAMVATNIDGTVYLVQEALPHLEESRGVILFTTSVSGLRGDWNQALYNATKGAMTTLMQSLALDLGGRGIRVNAVAPALTRTAANAAHFADPAATAPFADRTALGRIGEPEDVAPAFLFLASDDARYITGATLPVDGGTSASTGQAHVTG